MGIVMACYYVSILVCRDCEVIKSFTTSTSLNVTFKYLYDKKVQHPKPETLHIGPSLNGPWQEADLDESLEMLEALRYNFLKFKVAPEPLLSEGLQIGVSSESSVRQNAFDLLMSPKPRSLPQRKENPTSEKHRLYNSVIELLEQRGLSMAQSTVDTDGYSFVTSLTNALWSITSHHETINKRASHISAQAIPATFSVEQFQGCNNYKKKKQGCPVLNKDVLKSHADILNRILMKPIFTGGDKEWEKMAVDIKGFASCLNSYAAYLDSQADSQAKRRMLTHPARQVSDCASIQFIEKVNSVKEVYVLLDDVLKNTEIGVPLFFQETIHVSKDYQPMSADQRYRYFKNIKLSVDVNMLRYSPGGSHTTIVVFERVKDNRNQSEVAQDGVKLYTSVCSKLPEFHTYEMKRQFRQRFSRLAKIPCHVMRAIYHDLTLDASVDRNPVMDERVRMILEGETGLIADLRKFNSRPGGTYDVFFQKLGEELEQTLAADERRHNVAHLSEWISYPDLVKRVAEKCPEGTAVPSTSLVRLQFMPRNTLSHTSMSFAGRFAVQYKIQRRQLRATHPDNHFCAAQYKYLREYAVLGKEHVQLFCLDDKSKIPFGEPGSVLSTAVRGRMSLIPVNTTLAASDHDQNSKGNLTPSVSLQVNIPDTVEESFYTGQVSVVVNDAVFQASSPFRHAASLTRDLTPCKPILMLYTDGGPDHRLNYESVRLSLVAIFKRHNLDMVIAARCAPGQSWTNPVERVMSLLNLGLQNVALAREEGSEEFEASLKKCGSMAALRTISEQNESIKTNWTELTKPMRELVCGRFERLSLKGKPIQTCDPVSEEDIKSLFTEVTSIDDKLRIDKLQKKFVSKAKEYMAWARKHTRERTYTFQIRKCTDVACCSKPTIPVEDLKWLPDPVLDQTGEHYQHFKSVIGQDTTDDTRPSNQPHHGKVNEEEQGCSTSMLTAQRVVCVVKCMECGKPRCCYSPKPKQFKARDQGDVKMAVDMYDYTCGAPLLPTSHPLYKKVFVKLALTCGSPVEQSYFSSSHAIVDTCAHCGSSGGDRPVHLVEAYKTVLPICKECEVAGKTAIHHRPRVVLQSRSS